MFTDNKTTFTNVVTDNKTTFTNVVTEVSIRPAHLPCGVEWPLESASINGPDASKLISDTADWAWWWWWCRWCLWLLSKKCLSNWDWWSRLDELLECWSNRSSSARWDRCLSLSGSGSLVRSRVTSSGLGWWWWWWWWMWRSSVRSSEIAKIFYVVLASMRGSHCHKNIDAYCLKYQLTIFILFYHCTNFFEKNHHFWGLFCYCRWVSFIVITFHS